jgi:hypothetical protein
MKVGGLTFSCLIAWILTLNTTVRAQDATNMGWRGIRDALSESINASAPSVLDESSFVLVDPLPQSVEITNTDSGDAGKIANYIPIDDVNFTAGIRTVFQEYKSLLSDLARPEQPPSPQMKGAYSTLYELPPSGALIRGTGLTLRLKPMCVDYLRTNESIIQRLGEPPLDSGGSNYMVDGIIQLGAKHQVRYALEVLAREDVLQSFWVEAYSTAAGLASSQDAEGFSETLFVPERRKWSDESGWVWIELTPKGDIKRKASLQVLIVRVERNWLSWPLLGRKDWSWRDSSGVYDSVGLKADQVPGGAQPPSLLPAVPIALILAKDATVEGDMTVAKELSQWISGISNSKNKGAVVIGTICRRIQFKPADNALSPRSQTK